MKATASVELGWARVYEDPITPRKPEGMARLIRAIGKPEEGLQRYVEDGPDTDVERLVDLGDISSGPA